MNLKNSMILANMLSQKPKIMYVTIKGTLTESPEGVFSGFSASNYLKLQQKFQPANKNWEIVIKTEITQLNVIQTIIGSSGNTKNIQLSIRDTNILRFYRTTNGSDDVVNNSTLTIDSVGVYYFKISFNGSQYKVSVSQDGNNYINYIASTSSTPIYNNSAVLALAHNGRQTTEYFNGSIDVNNSYIKIGSTKYNLQAVVGYTIVGSPTIVDGVASGFSSANYLTLPSIPANSYNRIEIRTKITTGATIQAGNIIGDNTYYCNGLLINSDGTIVSQFNFSNYDRTRSDVIVEANTKYTIKTIVDVNAKSLMLNVNGTINTHTLQYYTNIKEIPYRFGYGYRNGTFNGSINVGETEIYINNKLWFNGQQA